MIKNIKILVLLAFPAILSACMNKGIENHAESGDRELDNVTVDTAYVMEVSHSEEYTSTVMPYALNNIVPVSGVRLEKINVDVGDFVSKGQVLVEAGTLKLEQAQLKYNNDALELERLRGLYEKGGVSQSEFELAEMAQKVSKKSLEDLRENTIVASPISGVVTAKFFDVGDLYVMGQHPVVIVQQIMPVKLLVGISESDYTRINIGDKVNITADALPGKHFDGRINKIYPEVDVNTRTVPVEIIVPNRDMILKPGMYAKVEITFGVEDSVVVPDLAVVKQPGSGQRFVFRLNDDNTVEICNVRIGRHFGTSYEILSGVGSGDRLVVKGQSNLKNGQKVNVVR